MRHPEPGPSTQADVDMIVASAHRAGDGELLVRLLADRAGSPRFCVVAIDWVTALERVH